MPRVRQESIRVALADDTWADCLVDININAAAEFYVRIPVKLLAFYPLGNQVREGRNGKVQLFRNTVEELIDSLKEALHATNKPDVKVEQVIRYNIESHVSFWLTARGEMVPNGYFDENRGKEQGGWNNSGKFGDHHANRPSSGGYSLTIGARALTKTTTTIGQRTTIKYKNMGENLATDSPAEKLNGWCSFTLPDECKEIPYTDEACMFFFDLTMGMAKLSKMIQDTTFDQDKLNELITNNQRLIT